MITGRRPAATTELRRASNRTEDWLPGGQEKSQAIEVAKTRFGQDKCREPAAPEESLRARGSCCRLFGQEMSTRVGFKPWNQWFPSGETNGRII